MLSVNSFSHVVLFKCVEVGIEWVHLFDLFGIFQFKLVIIGELLEVEVAERIGRKLPGRLLRWPVLAVAAREFRERTD